MTNRPLRRLITTAFLLFITSSSIARAERIDLSIKVIMSKIRSQQIAKEFVKQSPTFLFDGIPFSMRLTDISPNECNNCWTITFEFSCLHEGYGDRSRTAQSPLITPHTATIIIDQYEIIRADLDGSWDMLNQKKTDLVKSDW